MFSRYHLKYRFKFHFQFYRSVNSSGNLLWVFKNRALFWHYIISITFYLIKIYARLINEPSKIDIWWLFETLFIDIFLRFCLNELQWNPEARPCYMYILCYESDILSDKGCPFLLSFFPSLGKIQQIYDWLEYVKSNL